MKIRVDLHVHTSCSRDSLIRPEQLIEICDRRSISCVAVTDHNSIDCAKFLHGRYPNRIIIGEEIRTKGGEIIGLFLKDYIRPSLSPRDTVKMIKDQGGIVYVPHPFDFTRGSSIRVEALYEICDEIDILEVYNSRNSFKWSNSRAREFAKQRGIIAGAGSDAHSTYEIGRTFIEMEPFESPSDFLIKLKDASLNMQKTPTGFRLLTKMQRTVKKLAKIF